MNLQNAHKEMIDWMTAFGQECPNEPINPDVKTLKLRYSLISEEARETTHAFLTYKGDIIEILDGCGDLLFVTIGTLVALGVDTQAVWNEILRSNWTKFWNSVEITAITNEKWTIDPVETPFQAKKFLVKNEIGKVVKSPSFSPPDLTRFIPTTTTT